MKSMAAAGAAVAAGPAFAADTLKAADFDHVTIVCSDLARSIDFYGAVLGLRVETAPGAADAQMWLGARGQRFALTQASGSSRPGLYSFCLRAPTLDRAAAARIITAAGGAVAAAGDGTGHEPFTFTDRDGIRGQLVDAADLRAPGPALVTSAGGIEPLTINHVTLTVADVPRAANFYRRSFGMWVQSAQGRGAQVLGLGSKAGPEFPAVAVAVPYAGGPGINHMCLGVLGFDPARAMRALHRAGIRSVEKVIPSDPLTATIRWRQEETNGGGPEAPLGTPELYFMDPDKVMIQLQDISYCGGSGPLGSICSF